MLRLLSQFQQPLVYILLAAGAVTAGLRELVDAAVILGVVLMNAVVGFIQEQRAEQALAALQRLVRTEAAVRRDGQRRRIPAAALVPGDIVLLQAGDQVPAGLRLLGVKNLRTDESALTGESVPVDKHKEPLTHDAVLAERKNSAYGGTLVTYGQATGVVWASDSARRIDTDFRLAVSELGLVYVLGVQSSLGVWPPGCGPLPPKPWSGRGRPPTLWRRDAAHQPVTAKELALALPPDAWQKVSWRQGSAGELDGRFAAVRVRPSHRDYWRAEPHAEEWLLIEWPEGKKEPSKYWLSTLPATTTLVDLVGAPKTRWRIERDYQELKQELGLDHFEGRSWRGFHHHATLCIAAYGFLVRERSLFPPEIRFCRQTPTLPAGWRPRGCPHPTRAP